MLTQVNCMKILERKQLYEDEGAEKRGVVRSNINQSLLLCTKRSKISADVQESIKYDVRPQDSVLGVTTV